MLFLTDSTITAATPDISANHGHLRSTEVPRTWPEDTDLRSSGNGRIRLTDQTPIVRATITEAFELLHASVMLKHAFPDHLLTCKFIEDALSTAALHVPNAEDVHVRILQDHSYSLTMSALVCMCVHCLGTRLMEESSREPESASSAQRSRSAALLLLRPCSVCSTHRQ